jgi:hypothetical protein
MAAETEETAYRVVSPFVNAKVAGGITSGLTGRRSNWTVLGYYEGAILPPGVHPDDIARLLSGGHIEAVPAEVA